jgi:Flp pilus assembly protein TadG
MGVIQKFNNLRKNEDGATAVEFAFLAIPFVYMLVGILEMCLMFAGGTILHGGTGVAGRLVRTGQLQAQADPEAAFRTALCEEVSIFLNCDNIVYEVIDLGEGGFSAGSVAPPKITEDGEMEAGEFDPGEEGSVILVRASYLYPIVTPIFSSFLSDAPNNSKLFISTLVIKNEPYKYNGE